MKTGTYIYSDGTYSEKPNKSKTVVGILCNVTDTHRIGIMLKENKKRCKFDKGQRFCKRAGGRCPTINELIGIYLNKDKINIALKAINLPELNDSGESYWSSTEYNDEGAWALWMNNGSRECYYKYYPGYVRPVFDIPVKS